MELIKYLEQQETPVLNGSKAFTLELSKMSQIALMKKLQIDYPKSIAFNNLDALKRELGYFKFPCILKPNQGGSGARMYLIQSFAEIVALLTEEPELWLPDNLLILQEYLQQGNEGIVRMEFLDGELLYAMKVITDGSFNLCPSEYCNPTESESLNEVEINSSDPVFLEARTIQKSPEFIPYPDIPEDAVTEGKRLIAATEIDIGAIEYMDTLDGRRVFYDINANSNLRPSVANFFVLDYK